MKKIIIWKGHHGQEIYSLIQKTINDTDQLLILCPPRIDNVESYFPFLPSGKISFAGELKGQKALQIETDIKFPDVPSFGLFSTGTTDTQPKLILYSQKNLETSCEGIFSFFKDLKISHVFSYPQPYHIFGLALGYFASMKYKWSLMFEDGHYSRVHHEKWVSTVGESGAHLLTLGTPTHFHDAKNFIEEENLTLGPSLTAIAGGAKVEVGLWNDMLESLHIMYPSVGYGCSEASPGVTHLPPGMKPTDDGDLGFILPQGKLIESLHGFIYEGANVCTAIIQGGKIIYPRGRYLLNDTLELSTDGHYHFKKRTDLVLNRGGEKFSLEEIETLIKKDFQLASIALPVRDTRLGEELALLFEGKSDLAKKLHQRLNEVYKRNFKLDFILAIDKLPVNANAKFDRKQCLELMNKKLQEKND